MDNKKIEEIINTEDKGVDWTRVWSSKYPVLKEYDSIINISNYENRIVEMLDDLKSKYGFNNQDAMLVLKDILYKIYKKNM